MQKIFKNKYLLFLKMVYRETWQKYYIFSVSFKQNKKRLLLLIPENIGDGVFIVRQTKMLTEYKRKRYKVFQ